MKKLFLSAAVLAMIVSCSKNEDVKMPQGNAIAFSTLNNRVTKVANTNDDASHSNYKVFANESAAETWLINGEEMIGSDDTYKSLREYYWPATGTVDFFAYAPYADAALEEGTVTTASIPLTFTVPADANLDFTVATPVEAATSTTKGVTGGKVPMVFSHMLSKASFAVALEAKLAETHTFTFTNAGFVVDNNIVTADATAVKPAGVSAAGNATYAYLCTADNDAKPVSYTASNELLFAPQDGEGCSIVLTDVVIKNGENVIYKGDLTYKLVSGNVFEQGKAYNFAVTVNADATDLVLITFASTEAKWEDVSNVLLKTAEKPAANN